MVELIRQGYQAKQDQYIFTLTLKDEYKDVEHKEVQETINKFFDMFNVKVNTTSLFIKPETYLKPELKPKPEPKPEKKPEKKPEPKSDVWSCDFDGTDNTTGTTGHKFHTNWSTLAKIPVPKERQYAIVHEFPTEFTIDTYADYFIKRDFPEERVANRKIDKGIMEYEKRLRNNFYHDTMDLLNIIPPKIEEILTDGCSTRPKLYRVIDHTPEGRDKYLLAKLLEDNKIRLEG